MRVRRQRLNGSPRKRPVTIQSESESEEDDVGGEDYALSGSPRKARRTHTTHYTLNMPSAAPPERDMSVRLVGYESIAFLSCNRY